MVTGVNFTNTENLPAATNLPIFCCMKTHFGAFGVCVMIIVTSSTLILPFCLNNLIVSSGVVLFLFLPSLAFIYAFVIFIHLFVIFLLGASFFSLPRL